MQSAGLEDTDRRRLAVEVAHSFWSLFNQPAVISMIRSLDGHTETGRADAYWQSVIRYCRQGNLQAVLDEQWHLQWEQHAWSEGDGPADTATKCAAAIIQSAPPTRSRVHVRVLDWEGERLQRDQKRLRTIFAQRFGHIRTEDEKTLSQDVVRAAFNSPFRPFVLASTSIGQEGLDFHPWCRRLVHWDLPGNPVDLEQREEAACTGTRAMRCAATWWMHMDLKRCRIGGQGDDIWSLLFGLAEEAASSVWGAATAGLEPYWIAPR